MHSYYFNEDHDLFQQTFRTFLEKEVKPNVDQWEKDGELPIDIETANLFIRPLPVVG